MNKGWFLVAYIVVVAGVVGVCYLVTGNAMPPKPVAVTTGMLGALVMRSLK